MALVRKEIGKIEKLSKTELMCTDEGKRAVAGLGGTPTSEQTQHSLGRKSQKRRMLKQAWEGGLVKYCSPCRGRLPIIRARKKPQGRR